MRKYIREMLRNRAEKEGVKASTYVHDEFERMQVKKYGETKRMKNRAKGTHTRSKWKSRIEAVLDE